MKKFFIVLFSLFTAFASSAQDKSIQQLRNEAGRTIAKDPNDTIPEKWKVGGVFRVNGTQGAQSNWSAGGEDFSIALSSFLSGYAFYKEGRHSWDNTIDLAYGFQNTTSQGTRKSDDKIDLLSKYGYEVGKNWYASLLVNFKTQFSPGYSYPKEGAPVLTSDFLAPAYLIVSPGMNYKPSDNFSFFISPATFRWVIVKNDSLSSVGAFGVDSGQHVKLEFGAYASITYSHKISPTSVYSGRLDLFSNYRNDPQNVDVNWTNILAVKVTGILTMTFTFNLIYDNDVKTVHKDGTIGGASPQLQELLGLGIMLKL
jgi:hypothetical protein